MLINVWNKTLSCFWIMDLQRLGNDVKSESVSLPKIGGSTTNIWNCHFYDKFTLSHNSLAVYKLYKSTKMASNSKQSRQTFLNTEG